MWRVSSDGYRIWLSATRAVSFISPEHYPQEPITEPGNGRAPHSVRAVVPNPEGRIHGLVPESESHFQRWRLGIY
jgi:hypothetical protein